MYHTIKFASECLVDLEMSSRQPLERVHDLARRLDELEERSGRAMRQGVVRSQQRLAALAGQLETLSPLQVLGHDLALK